MQSATPNGAILFLHGSGDTGENFQSWINSNKSFLTHFKSLGFIFSFPTAPLVPYTLNEGIKSNVWFDRIKLSIDAPEDMIGIQNSISKIDQIIDSFIMQNITLKNIFVFGMSMGGHMALQILNRSKYSHSLGGIVALSCFISKNSTYWDEMTLKIASSFPPLLMCHGNRDTLVLHDWGVFTSSKLKSMGISIQFHTIDRLTHDISYEELELIKKWIDTLYTNNTTSNVCTDS